MLVQDQRHSYTVDKYEEVPLSLRPVLRCRGDGGKGGKMDLLDQVLRTRR